MNTKVQASAESAIQNGVALLANNIDDIDQKTGALWDKLNPVLSPSKVPPEAKPTAESVEESPLLNQLAGLKARSDKIILGLEQLLERIQC